MALALLGLTSDQISTAVAERVCQRQGSVFARLGGERARTHANTCIAALEHDLDRGGREQVRTMTNAMLDELAPLEPSFSDFRLFVQTTRKLIMDALQHEPAQGVVVEGWFFEFLLVASLRFMAWRDEAAQKEAARLGTRRYEAQLAELEQALEEKTALLELVRQASTPIAPVYDGILVVPLVGTFDSFRASVLTEKLLDEIARSHARTAILDISGVPLFDTHAAQLIIRLGRTVRLLGTRVFLVGMSPDNARTIIELGIDLADIETFATLRDGLARALLLQRKHIAPLPKE